MPATKFTAASPASAQRMHHGTNDAPKLFCTVPNAEHTPAARQRFSALLLAAVLGLTGCQTHVPAPTPTRAPTPAPTLHPISATARPPSKRAPSFSRCSRVKGA